MTRPQRKSAIEGRPTDWVGKHFRNVHSGESYQVHWVSFCWVGYHNIDDPGHTGPAVHYRTFKKHWRPL